MELVEQVVHWTATGHSAHDGDEDHEPATGEHGCSGSFHACSCHSTASFVVAQAPIVEAPLVRAVCPLWEIVDPFAMRAPAAVFRPPIA